MARWRAALFQHTLGIYYPDFRTDNAPNVSVPGALQSWLAFLAESTNVERQLGINYLMRSSLVESFLPLLHLGYHYTYVACFRLQWLDSSRKLWLNSVPSYNKLHLNLKNCTQVSKSTIQPHAMKTSVVTKPVGRSQHLHFWKSAGSYLRSWHSLWQAVEDYSCLKIKMHARSTSISRKSGWDPFSAGAQMPCCVWQSRMSRQEGEFLNLRRTLLQLPFLRDPKDKHLFHLECF